MFNLNIPPSSLLAENSGLCSTPKTPEIVNSLFAMTNPMDTCSFTGINTSVIAPASIHPFYTAHNVQITSQDSSHSSCSTSQLESPTGVNSTPSIQQTRSQLIKAGLKRSIESKRKLSTCDSSSGCSEPTYKFSHRDEDCEDTTDDDFETKEIPKGLTPEDEDRRRRRRERNKIAATKCRMKKRERTQNLIKESEQLDMQNVDLKTQVHTLETERRKLLEMLQSHSSTCLRSDGFSLPSKLLHSPAIKYVADIELISIHSEIKTKSTAVHNVNKCLQTLKLLENNIQKSNDQNASIPPMSTIKFFSGINGIQTPISAATTNSLDSQEISEQSVQSPLNEHHHQELPNGYCKASPTPQELAYIKSSSQDNTIHPSHMESATKTHQISSGLKNPISDYIPNCDNSLGSGTPAQIQLSASNNDKSNALLARIIRSSMPAAAVNTSTTTDFVKNELVDSQSPYITAQSAERFLFEANCCDNFTDIRHALGAHSNGNHNSMNNNTNSINILANNNLMDFQSPLINGNTNMGSFHDQISLKNDFYQESDLLVQLADEAGDGELVDLDTGVAVAFLTNNGCLA